ncbi:hypothetical protein PIB30_032288 [Stylosanthes scabra]|uniref:Uncharacterized protein n=1 Tax=Stylosanthes scabra TaxID=79078 RepID=A0ABU6YCE1_9FABA|nr:hypothetical protein [Stylosanthes scabra]
MTFVELKTGLCEYIDGHVLKSVNQILYRMSVQIFREAIYFDTMAIVDEVSMRHMVQCYQQIRAHVPTIELFVDFDVLSEVEEDPEMDNENEDELKANYEVGDEDKDDEEGRDIVAIQGSSNQPMNQHPDNVSPFIQAVSALPTNQHPFGVPSYIFAVNFADMNAQDFQKMKIWLRDI